MRNRFKSLLGTQAVIHEQIEHKISEGNEMRTSHRDRKPLTIPYQARQASDQATERSTTQRRESQDKTVLGLRKFDDLQLDALLKNCLSRSLASVILIHKGDLHRLIYCFLNSWSQFSLNSIIASILSTFAPREPRAALEDGFAWLTSTSIHCEMGPVEWLESVWRRLEMW